MGLHGDSAVSVGTGYHGARAQAGSLAIPTSRGGWRPVCWAHSLESPAPLALCTCCLNHTARLPHPPIFLPSGAVLPSQGRCSPGWALCPPPFFSSVLQSHVCREGVPDSGLPATPQNLLPVTWARHTSSRSPAPADVSSSLPDSNALHRGLTVSLNLSGNSHNIAGNRCSLKVTRWSARHGLSSPPSPPLPLPVPAA